MSVFSYDLTEGDIEPTPDLDPRKFVVDELKQFTRVVSEARTGLETVKVVG